MRPLAPWLRVVLTLFFEMRGGVKTDVPKAYVAFLYRGALTKWSPLYHIIKSEAVGQGHAQDQGFQKLLALVPMRVPHGT